MGNGLCGAGFGAGIGVTSTGAVAIAVFGVVAVLGAVRPPTTG